MKREDLSRLFSTKKLNGVPTYKLLVSAVVVLALVATMGVTLAAGVLTPAPTATPAPTETPAPTAEPTPEPTAEPVPVKLEATAVQQNLGVEVQNEEGEPIVGVPFVLTVTDEKQNTQTYDVDTETGTILVEKVEPGDYTVGMEELEGYAAEPVTITVKAKVVYKADTAAVKEKIVQASQVVESKEDNSFGNTTPVKEELTNTAEAVESSKTAITVDRALYIGAKLQDGYMVLTDGTVTDYQPVYATVLEHQAIVGAKRVPRATAAPTPAPTAEPTAAPTEAPTAEPTAEPTTEPTAEPTAEPKTQPSASPEASPEAIEGVKTQVYSMTVQPLAALARAMNSTESWPDEITLYDASTYTTQNADKYAFDLTSTTVNVETGEYLYTGWTEINGYSYYYTKDHKALTGSQVIDGVMYQFDETGALKRNSRGVDVSKYQGSIDWNKVKASGIDFAIIRVGYRGYGSGALVEDSSFRANIKGATAAGLRVGLYFYSQAIDEAEAVEEASMVLSLCQGYNIGYPIFFDTEKVAGDTGRADNISKAERTACAVAFCETIRNAGYQAGVYSYASWFYNQLNLANLGKYKIWIAQYRDTLSFNSRYDIWQYSSKGSVPGIPKAVDMNIGY